MAEIRSEKYVTNLPSTLIANTIYYVKNGLGFDMYITNNNGIIIAYPINTSNNIWKQITINVPFPAKNLYTVNIIDNQVTNTSIINLMLDSTTDFDENDIELYNIDFKTKSNNGNLDITIISKDQNVFGGIIKLKYKIN